MRKLLVYALAVFSGFLFYCSDNFSTDLSGENLSKEDSLWLLDDDDNGVADSVEKYARTCQLTIEECLELAKDIQQILLNAQTLTAPSFNFPSGTYDEVIVMDILADSGVVIRYTTDGSDPDENSNTYSLPIQIDTTTVIKAVAFLPGAISSPITTVEYIISILEKLDAPEFSRDPGIFSGTLNLALSAAVPGTDIFYTTDGSVPTYLSQKYSGPLQVNRSLVINAIALHNDFLQSEVATGSFELKAPPPLIVPGPGNFNVIVNAVLTTDLTGARIYYTNDGSDPDENSTEYKGKIEISSITTLKSRVYFDGWTPSDIRIDTFNVELPGVASGSVFNPPGGTYDTSQIVTITSATAGAEIRYTIDGSDPDESSKLYIGPFVLYTGTVIKAIVSADGFVTSPVSMASYQIRAGPTLITPASGSFDSEITVEMTTTGPGIQIRYTFDGNMPDTGSSLYTAPIPVQSTGILIARTFGHGLIPGEPDTAIHEIQIPGVAASPWFTPTGGEYASYVTVSLNSLTPGVFIFYTTDGSTPDSTATLFSAPFTLTDSTVVKAIAVKEGMIASEVSSATYSFLAPDPVVAAPVFTPTGGVFNDSISVSIISATEGATIYFTQDGTEPDTSSSVFSGPIVLTVGTVLKAIAVKEGHVNSQVSSGSFGINTTGGTVATPVISPGAGNYTGSVNISLTTETDGADIYYTLDGTSPDSNSPLYTAGFVLTESATLKAIAYLEGMNPSTVSSATYSVTPAGNTVATPVFTPSGAIFYGYDFVFITTATEGASIYYTMDGSDPTTSSTLYVDSIKINVNTTLKAIAVKDSMDNSIIATGTYLVNEPLDCYPPTFEPAGGNYPHTITVTLSTETPGGEIYYTTNGSHPYQHNGTLYTVPFVVSQSAVVMARTYKDGLNESVITSVSYNITHEQIPPTCITAADCDDGNACTTDDCNGTTCTYSNNIAGTPCDDGVFCTGDDDQCDGSGNCLAGTGADCDDNNDCTVDVCLPGYYYCNHFDTFEGLGVEGTCSGGGDEDCDNLIDELDPDCTECSGSASIRTIYDVNHQNPGALALYGRYYGVDVTASCALPISITGDGSPQFSNFQQNDWGTNGYLVPGEDVQIRAFASTTPGATHTVTFNVGTSSAQWNIKTCSGNDCMEGELGQKTGCYNEVQRVSSWTCPGATSEFLARDFTYEYGGTGLATCPTGATCTWGSCGGNLWHTGTLKCPGF